MLVNCSLFYWHLERETRYLHRSFSQRVDMSTFLIFTTHANDITKDSTMDLLRFQNRLMRSGIDISCLGKRIHLVLQRFLRFLIRRHPAWLAPPYISQNQIVSKVHSPDSPSASKEIGRDTPSTMQALVSTVDPSSQFRSFFYEFFHFEEFQFF